MPEVPSQRVVLVVESAFDDEAITLRALRRTGVPMRVEVERAGDDAIRRYRADFVQAPPSLLVVADGLLRVRAHEVVRAVREIHGRGALAILHLLSSEGHLAAEGVDASVVKPVAYDAYLEAIGTAARHLLLGRDSAA